jgi:hypothetical protein
MYIQFPIKLTGPTAALSGQGSGHHHRHRASVSSSVLDFRLRSATILDHTLLVRDGALRVYPTLSVGCT